MRMRAPLFSRTAFSRSRSFGPPTFTFSTLKPDARRVRSIVPSIESIPIVYEVGGLVGERPSTRQRGSPRRLPSQSCSAASIACFAPCSPGRIARRRPMYSRA
jgi:hypothetical protein